MTLAALLILIGQLLVIVTALALSVACKRGVERERNRGQDPRA
jgi:hypothetical protein